MKYASLIRRILTIGMVTVCGIEASETVYTFPSITYSTAEEQHADFLNDGKWLMTLKGIPDGDETLVCTNWVCPTSIVVNAEQYLVETNMLRITTTFKVMTTNVPPVRVASGFIDVTPNGKKARLLTFANSANTSLYLPHYAPGVCVRTFDPTTNALFITFYRHPSDTNAYEDCNFTYKNIMFLMYAPTNAVDFAVAILNAGLPENERIPVE